MPTKPYDPSPDRQRLSLIAQEFDKVLDAFRGHDPMVNGRFVTLRRRCGKPRCRCLRGALHETEVFIDRSTGRRRTCRATRPLRRGLQAPVRRYRESRRLAVHLRELYRETRRLCRRLDHYRLALGAKLARRLLE